MRIVDVLLQQSDAILAQSVKEVVEWRKSGVLTGNGLRSLVASCGEGVDLRQVEQELVMLAATRWANSVK